jgi:UDP-glucose 4-epimerase
MNVLVTGGAGYIGSVCVKKLLEKGHTVVVIDNLSKGKKELISNGAILYEVDLVDKEKVLEVFQDNLIDAVIHFAGYKAVGESMADAVKYSDNITGTINLLNVMVKTGVKNIIYSSSAAVYGMPDSSILDEDIPTRPINWYGYTKLSAEETISWYGKIYGITYVSLRYFNVAGDGGLLYVDPDAQNVLPIIMEVVFGKRDSFTIFGNDYDTEDGTCIRDYIDVNDLIDAHILALDVQESHIINLGTGKGFSVKELLDSAISVVGKEILFSYGPRREGDPAVVIATNEKAKEILKWQPKVGLNEMIKTTYQAYEKSYEKRRKNDS